MKRRWRRLKRRVRRVVKRIRYGRHARPIRRGVLLGGGLLIVLSAIWLVVTALLARQQLARLQGRIDEVKLLVSEGQVDQARAVAADIPRMARRAHHLTTGPVWWIGAHVPYFGEPLEVARGASVVTDRLGNQTVPDLMQVATLINPAKLRASGHTIRIQPLKQAAPTLAKAAAAVDAASAQMSSLPSDTWLGPVNSRAAALELQVRTIQGYVDAAARVASALPDLLGAHTTQRYFIGLQNEAELRGTGGLPGAFAIAEVRDGTITFTHFESDSALEPPKTPNHEVRTGLDFGAQYNALYAPAAPTSEFVNSNLSPHFPYAAQIWAAMWQKVSGERIDNVIALDPTALSYFLAATGPAALPDGTVVSAANVVSLTQKDNYTLFSDNNERKAFLVSVLRGAAHKVTSGAGTALNLIRAASLASNQQRFIAWSRDPRIEKLLKQTKYASAVPQNERPFSALIVNNAAAGKLDYYLSRSLTYQRTGCGARRDVLVTFTLTDNAPASGLPLYVIGRADDPPPGAQPGDTHELVDYFASKGALLDSVTLNGTQVTASVQPELGHTVLRMDLELPRGKPQTVVLHLDEPAGKGAPLIWRQPGVTPLTVRELNQHC